MRKPRIVKKFRLEIEIDNEKQTLKWNVWHSYNRLFFWRVHNVELRDLRDLLLRLVDNITDAKTIGGK